MRETTHRLRSLHLVLSLALLLRHAVGVEQNPPPPALDSNAEFGDVPKVPAGVPVFPKQEMMNLSPEQLVRASLPWQGMDTPWRQPGGPGAVGNAWRLSKFARMNYARREPWDTDRDVDQDAPFDNSISAPVAMHPPPYYIGDGDHEANKKLNDPTWERVVLAPPLLPNGPAQYGHGYKPPGYYHHPFKRLGTSTNNPVQVFLEEKEKVAVAEGSRSERSDTTTGKPKRTHLRGSSFALLEIEETPTITGVSKAKPWEVLGVPPTHWLSNPKMTTNTQFATQPISGQISSLHFDSEDTKVMSRVAPAPVTGVDMMIPPTALSSRQFDVKEPIEQLQKKFFQNLDIPPAGEGGPYTQDTQGLYPPRPPEPLFS